MMTEHQSGALRKAGNDLKAVQGPNAIRVISILHFKIKRFIKKCCDCSKHSSEALGQIFFKSCPISSETKWNELLNQPHCNPTISRIGPYVPFLLNHSGC
jgi:hypothetical protein